MNAEWSPELSTDVYAAHIAADAARIVELLTDETLAVDVPSCPGMDVGKLVVHLGVVYRWAAHCMRTGEGTDMRQFKPADGTNLATWLSDSAADNVDAVMAVDLDAPTFHPFPVVQVGRVWPRRMAQESLMHRWDVEHAVSAITPIDAGLASDGIDEYFDLVVRRRVSRDGYELPTGSLHVHCTDVDGEWLVWADADGYHLEREHRKGDAALRGPAAPLLLRLWNRATGPELSPVGDEAVLAAWLDVGGM